MMEGLTHILSVMADCINFAPYDTKYQPKNKCKEILEYWGFQCLSFQSWEKLELL